QVLEAQRCLCDLGGQGQEGLAHALRAVREIGEITLAQEAMYGCTERGEIDGQDRADDGEYLPCGRLDDGGRGVGERRLDRSVAAEDRDMQQADDERADERPDRQLLEMRADAFEPLGRPRVIADLAPDELVGE